MPLTRSALDQLALHEAALGRLDRAAAVVLSGRTPGLEAAERLALAARWLEALGQHDAGQLIEAALDQAAAGGGLGTCRRAAAVAIALGTQRGWRQCTAAGPLGRLATRVDDRYTLWQLLQDGAESPEQDRQRAELERQLRSPRDQAGQSSLEESRKPGPAGYVTPANP